MTGTAASRVRSGPSPSALASDHLTHVELTWIEKRIEYWIRFGDDVHELVAEPHDSGGPQRGVCRADRPEKPGSLLGTG